MAIVEEEGDTIEETEGTEEEEEEMKDKKVGEGEDNDLIQEKRKEIHLIILKIWMLLHYVKEISSFFKDYFNKNKQDKIYNKDNNHLRNRIPNKIQRNKLKCRLKTDLKIIKIFLKYD